MDGKTKGDSSPHHSDVGRGALALSLTVLLIQACASGDVAAVADLVSEKNVDPFAGDESGRTPLAVACEAGHMEVVKFLMERDKEGRALTGAGGTTPLHVAARGGHIDLVQLTSQLRANLESAILSVNVRVERMQGIYGEVLLRCWMLQPIL